MEEGAKKPVFPGRASRTYQEEVEKVNLGEDGEIKEVKIGTSF